MKKMMDAVARRFGYMPVSEHEDEMNDLARCWRMEVKRAWRDARRDASAARQEALSERRKREQIEAEFASTTSAANRELAAVTARIPLP